MPAAAVAGGGVNSMGRETALARRVIESSVCDLPHSTGRGRKAASVEVPAVVTKRFSVDGKDFELDVCEEHASEFEQSMEIWVSHARRPRRRASQARARATRPRSTASRSDLDAVRMWARENGHAVADKGRIPVAVMTAYEAAH